MNNARPKPVAEINLEEFERRLRASAAPQAGVEDPLAELTRLVDAIGFERTPSERALEASRPAPKPDLRLASPPQETPKSEPPQPRLAIEPPAPPAPPPLLDAEPALRPSFDAEDLDSSAFEPPAPSLETAGPAVEASPAAARARGARSRNWGLKVGGLVAAAAIMAGAVVVFKVGGHAHSGAPVLVLAPTTPTKVAPPNDVTIRTANESGALLNRDTAQPTPTPPKLVDPPEAPVDLSARPEASPSPTASLASPTPAASAAAPSPTASATATADASPVAPSADTPIVATPSAVATPTSPVSADPSRVKTISVRPDGTLISSGYEAAAPAQAPVAQAPVAQAPVAQAPVAQAPVAQAPVAEAPAAESPATLKQADAETPSPALPTKLSPPKASTRVVSRTPPADIAPKAEKPEAEAKSDDAEPAAPSGGGYAVQFAAPRSENEAKALIKRFQSRFSAAIGGAQFVVRKAERHGETLYRVRTVGLTKAEAKAMCAKVKAAGGDCYYARD
jgi:hypothetical protein